MGGCCGAMKTGQKSLPDKKKSADPIQEKPNGKEVAAQATVSANDTGKVSPIDKGEIHAEGKPTDGDGHAQQQIAIPVKVSFNGAEPGHDAVEAPGVQAVENVMDLETAVAPFESLASTGGDHSQQEAQDSITSAEPEVLLPFQIPVQHAFTSSTITTTTTTRYEGDHEEVKLRVEELQLDSAFPGDIQLSITENVQDVPIEHAPASGDVEIPAKSFASAEVEAVVPEPLSAERVDVGVEDAVARVERAILEAQLPVEEDLPPPPPLEEASQPEELEAGGRIEVNASYPEVPMDPEAMWRAGIMVCPLERKPSPERKPRPPPGVVVCPLEQIERPQPGPDAGYVICPIGQEPEPRPDSGIMICPLERIPRPEPESKLEWEIQTCEPCLPEPEPPLEEASQPEELEAGGRIEVNASYPEVPMDPEAMWRAGIMVCPLERKPSPERKPRPPPGVVVCPLEQIERPQPGPDAGYVIYPIGQEPEPRPDSGIMICPLERIPRPEPESKPEWETQTCEPCLPEPEPRPEWEIQTCEPCLPEPEPELQPDPTICVCPLEEIPFPRPEPRPEPVIAICPPDPELVSPPEPWPEPDIAVCPPEPDPAPQPEILSDLDTQPTSEDPRVVHESADVQEQLPAAVPDSISFGESTVTEEAAIPVHLPSQEVAFTEESHFQEQLPVELGLASKLEDEPQILAEDNLPPPVVEEPATLDSLLESYEVLDASTEQLPQPPPVEEEIGSAEPIVSFTDNEQFSEQSLSHQTEQTAAAIQQEQLPEEPAPYQEQPPIEVLEPYHEHQSVEPAPYQEHQTTESAFQPEHQLQDTASQQTSETLVETVDAAQSSPQEQEQPEEASDPLPVLEVVSQQAQESRDAWWNEGDKEQGGQQVTSDDIPVLELVSEQVREAHQIWWDQPGAAAEAAAQPGEATTDSLLDTAQPTTTEHGSAAEAPSSIPLSEGESISPPIATDGSFSEVTPEPVSVSSDPVVVGHQEAEIIPEGGKALPLPVVESPSSADGSSSSTGPPTENGEVSTQSSDEAATPASSNLSPESLDGPAPAVAAVSTEEAIPTQA